MTVTGPGFRLSGRTGIHQAKTHNTMPKNHLGGVILGTMFAFEVR
jgi:hypothetical protein